MKMKAALLKEIGNLEITETEVKRPASGEILIKVKACAICGTDIKVFHHGHRLIVFPRVTGHELSGVIEEIGSGVSGYKKGERVAVAPAIPCGMCYYCRRGWQAMCDNLKAIGYHFDGAFAEYMIVPETAVRNGCVNRIPDNLDFDGAAIAEPLACVINGQMLSMVEPGDTVTILGAGPIGCLHAENAKYLGASKVILCDISQERLTLAKFTNVILVDMGKEDVKKTVRELTGGRGSDRVIVAVGAAPAHELAFELVAKRGCVNLFGGLPKEKPFINFNSNTIHYGEIYVVGTHGSAPRHNVIALDLLSSGKIKAENYITERIPLEKLAYGLKLVEDRKAMKVVVNP